MTLARFEQIMSKTGLRRCFFGTNVSENSIVRLMALIRRVPGLEEYFTANVYSIWGKQQTKPHSQVTRGASFSRPEKL